MFFHFWFYIVRYKNEICISEFMLFDKKNNIHIFNFISFDIKMIC